MNIRIKAFVLSASLALAGSLSGAQAGEAEAEAAAALARLVADRPANEGRVGMMHFALVTKAGDTRTREALMLHSDRGDSERIAIFFASPAMIEGTAFLNLQPAGAEEENWLYLPATERTRRLPVSERGDYFMGTDLTYGDISDNFRFDLDDWTFALDGEEEIAGVVYPVLTGQARTPAAGQAMGYASFRARIDTTTAFPVFIEYTDVDGEPLKRVEVLDIGKVGTADTALRFSVLNLQTGHRTDIHFTDMRYVEGLDEEVFDPDVLAFGLPVVD